ncbi:MAG: ArgR family transcriptional regulator [Chloroflexi bacterium]|nr:ArgR family transcriptional regulator [Chloroflexota bacterium]
MPRTTRATKRERQRTMQELVARQPIASQDEFARLLGERGFDVTQATVSRDIAELRLVKVVRADRHVYASPDDLASQPQESDAALERMLSDLPIVVRRSGLTLLLVSTPGTASVIAEAIDHSSLHEQEGTLAGDNTVLVLFADDERLERWRDRIEAIRSRALGGLPAVVRDPPRPPVAGP